MMSRNQDEDIWEEDEPSYSDVKAEQQEDIARVRKGNKESRRLTEACRVFRIGRTIHAGELRTRKVGRQTVVLRQFLKGPDGPSKITCTSIVPDDGTTSPRAIYTCCDLLSLGAGGVQNVIVTEDWQ